MFTRESTKEFYSQKMSLKNSQKISSNVYDLYLKEDMGISDVFNLKMWPHIMHVTPTIYHDKFPICLPVTTNLKEEIVHTVDYEEVT